MQKTFAADRCPIRCPIRFDRLCSFCYHLLPGWSMGKLATPLFTVVPGMDEYVEVHL